MRRTGSLLAAFAVAAIALAPSLAFARAGGGASMGSRGGFTYSAPPATSTAPYSASPMQRSMTPNYAPSAPSPGYAPAPGYGSPGYARPGLFGGGFGSGLMGGLIGAGIGGMLFGHGMFGGISGFGSIFGLLIQLALIFFIGRWLLGMFMRRQPAPAGGGGMFGRMMPNANMGAAPLQGGGIGGGGAPQARPLAISPADYQAFEQLLQAVQAAWSNHDLNTLRGIASPEMVSYFAEQLGEQTSRGVRNLVTDVRLEKGDLAQSWAEPGREYATVAMRFSMIDVTRDQSERVVDGSPTERQVVTEIWTFLRAPGARWILSAIQQTR